MPRRPRLPSGGYVFHVLNRAVRRQRIFATKSPCRGKASDGGELGLRYTPEMRKIALNLRRQGIIKF